MGIPPGPGMVLLSLLRCVDLGSVDLGKEELLLLQVLVFPLWPWFSPLRHPQAPQKSHSTSSCWQLQLCNPGENHI